jgi:hypothetical protein
MKPKLIIAAGLLSMVAACAAGPDGGTPAYFNSADSYYDSTYYNGRYDADGYNRTHNFGRAYVLGTPVEQTAGDNHADDSRRSL